MKNFFKAHIAPIFGIIAAVAVIGFSMTACGGGDDNDGGGGGSISWAGTWKMEGESDRALTLGADGVGWAFDYGRVSTEDRLKWEVDNNYLGLGPALLLLGPFSGGGGEPSTTGVYGVYYYDRISNTKIRITSGTNGDMGGDNDPSLNGVWEKQAPVSIPAEYRGEWYAQSMSNGRAVYDYHYIITASTIEINQRNSGTVEWDPEEHYITTVTRVVQDIFWGGHQFYYDSGEFSFRSFYIDDDGMFGDFALLIPFSKTPPWENGGNNPGVGKPEWPEEFIFRTGMQSSFWGKTSNPNPQNIGFYHASDGDGRKTAYMSFEPGGDQRGYELTKIEGKTLTVTTGVGPSGQTTPYILCTNWTVENNYLTLTGGASHFSSVMDTPLRKDN